MSSTDNDYSLREKKSAKTKIALARAFVERLKTTRFADISIKEVCESVEVSEGTFFNYFPQKIDIVFYYKTIIGLKITWDVIQAGQDAKPLQVIERIFDLIAESIEHPYLFYEFISIFTAEKQKPKQMELTPPEKKYAYPDLPGIEEVPVVAVEETFITLVGAAQADGQIERGITPDEILMTLMTILIGTPLAIDIDNFSSLSKEFRKQLSLLWKAIGGIKR